MMQNERRMPWISWTFLRQHILLSTVLVLSALVLVYDTYRRIRESTGADNTHAYQADAFLKGKIEIEKRLHDTALLDGRIYSHFPPFPAIVLLPFVAVFGVEGTNPFLVKLALTGMNIIVLWTILRRVGVDSRTAGWVIAGFFAGTAYWPVAGIEGVWWFSQVVAVSCMFPAIWAGLHGWGLLSGCFLGAAVLSRQMCVYSAVFLIVLLWENAGPSLWKRLWALSSFAAMVAASLGVYLWFNWARFGAPFESGYRYLEVGAVWTENIKRFGLFSPAYVPFNLYQLLFQGFHFELTPDRLQMDRNGTSITFASPWVFAAFWAVWKRPLVAAAWISIILTQGHLMVYYSNGWAQINAQRYTLDFLPIAVLLIALGLNRLPDRVWKAAITYSIVLNFLALVLLPRSWSLLTRLTGVAIGP
jgi:hypothetical protein